MIYALGPFCLHTHDAVLFRGTEPVALGRRAVALLCALVERPGALVSKDVLIEAAWPGQAVEDSNLTVQIAALRRVLGEATPGADRWIETMPRHGYRFVGPVVAKETPSPPVVASAENPVTEVPSPVAVPREAAPIEHVEAERRQITALFCELVDMAAGTHGVDLEDWHESVGGFQHCVAQTAARHKGFIARHLGNNVLVLFGYPEAHELDAERAVRAGLEMCAAVRRLRPAADVTLHCRAGIATGLVIIADPEEAIGGGALQDHEIVGDAPGVAARLLASAPPDTVAIDGATRRLIGNLFDCRDLGAIKTAGGTEPMLGWQVLGESIVESRFEALRGSALTPLVGRDEEIDLLLRRWRRAKAGAGQIVVVCGEPGIGKSRLIAELEERLHGEPHLRLRYFCSPHHQNSALFPFIEQLGHAAAFARDDTPAAKLEKLEGLITRAVPGDEDAALLADLLSLPCSERHSLPNLSAQRKKERTLKALLRQLESVARRQPVVVVFEDAHWIDPTSHELLDLTVERVRNLPVLLIVTFRPEFQPPWAGEPQVTMMVLNRLDRRDRAALVAQVVGSKALPDEVIDQIAERTDGVPLFVEELTKNVLESGVLREEDDRYVLNRALLLFAIPTTLRASLLARLDRLATVRHVAQIGAAIGRQFSYALLQAASRLPEDELQAALARLVASELVFQRGAPPEAFYTFKHALVQDAAHDSVLRNARRQLHAQIAQALESHFPEIIESQPELLAQHYAEAGLIEKSIAYWGKAGRRSVARSAMTEAAAQFQKALDQLALLPENSERQRQELEFRTALGTVLIAVKGFSAAETGDAYARARELWEQLGSPSEFLQVPYGQSLYHAVRGDLDLAQRLDEDLRRLSLKRNDAAGLVMAHWSSGRDLMFVGRFASSRSHLEQALAIYDPNTHHSLVEQTGFHFQVVLRVYLALILFCLGFPDQALEWHGAAIAEARGLPHPPSLLTSSTFGCRLLSLVGDDQRLEEQVDEVNAVTVEQGFPFWDALAMIYRGWLNVKNGDADGISILRTGLSAYRATGAEVWMPHHIALLAGAYEISGQIEEAVTQLDEGFQIVERTGERWLEAELYRQKGRLLLRQGHSKAAEELYRKAVSIAREQEAKLWELRAAMSLARLWRDEACRADARDLLVPVYGWFAEGFATPDLKKAKALLDELT